MSSPEYKRRKRAELRAKTDAIKVAAGCALCYQHFPAECLDFDHDPAFPKLMDISSMVSKGMAWGRIEAEIAKTRVLCAVCHRSVTRQRAVVDSPTC